MNYDQEKYRIKREKVLGAKKGRGLNFNTVLTIVSIAIILGLGFIVVPSSVNYMATRNLDDVIYKLKQQKKWSNEVMVHMSGIKGVEDIILDKNSTRLVITFDKTVVDTDSFSSIFRNQKLEAILLNRMNHRQRLATLKEEANFETL